MQKGQGLIISGNIINLQVAVLLQLTMCPLIKKK